MHDESPSQKWPGMIARPQISMTVTSLPGGIAESEGCLHKKILCSADLNQAGGDPDWWLPGASNKRSSRGAGSGPPCSASTSCGSTSEVLPARSAFLPMRDNPLRRKDWRRRHTAQVGAKQFWSHRSHNAFAGNKGEFALSRQVEPLRANRPSNSSAIAENNRDRKLRSSKNCAALRA